MKKYEPIEMIITAFNSEILVLGESKEWETDKIAPTSFGKFE